MSDQQIAQLIDTLREQAQLLQTYDEQLHAANAMLSAARELTELHAIAVTARQVRAAQNKYFATRSHADLVASKRLEKELDAMLAPKPAVMSMPPLPGL